MPGRVSDRVALQPQGRGILEDVSANEFAPGNTRTTPVTAGDIELAAQRISGAVRATPLERSERLSDVTGANVRLKREDLQSVRSYKIRGAFNFLASLDSDQRLAGVVTASAGNHAQGVAWSCRQLGIHGSIYVPENTPKQKRDRIRAFGGDFVDLMVTGENFDAAQDAALAHSADYDSAMVPPFDHPETIAGQGTIGVEILEQLDSSPDLVVIPVGGGGLLAGIATYLSEKAPECKIVAVEPSGAASLTAASNEGHQVTLTHVDTFVDGASVKRIGDNPWATYQALAGNIDVRTVDEGAVCTEMLELYQTEGIIAEPAGALSTTIVKDLRIAPDSNVVCILSGGNNDVSRYSEVIERSLVHKELKHYFLVNFPQEPGQLRRFLNEVLGPEDDITRFEYLKRNNRDTGTALVGIELGRAEDLGALKRRMDSSPLHCELIEPGTPAYTYLT